MPETLRVDTGLVLEAGANLQSIAAAIPPPPSVSAPGGADALSMAIAAKIAEVVDPVIAQLPISKQELKAYSEKVKAAAHKYEMTERQIAEDIRERIAQFDALFNKCAADAPGAPSSPAGSPTGGGGPAPAGGGGTGSGGGASGGSGAGSPAETGTSTAATAGAPAASSGGSPAGAAQQAGQMGQMMQVPMQMAQQAAQIPMQMMGMAAAIPQAVAQGVQAVMQGVGQISEMSGTGDEQLENDERKQAEPAEKQSAEGAARPEPRADEAAPGNSGGERVPEPQTQEAQPQTPTEPKPAPTRPAESAPETAL
jgi:hypothetical protein